MSILRRRLSIFVLRSVRLCSSSSSSSGLPWKSAISPGESTLIVGNQRLKLECGRLARFADGAAVCRVGHTAVLVTAVSAKPSLSYADGWRDFVPLTVDYRQKAAAAGRVPSNRLRRELGQTDQEILTSRLVDRSLRPLFPKGLVFGETQIVCNLLAVDGINDGEVAAINAASFALALSDIPWEGPVGAVRLGLLGDQVLVNPTRTKLKESRLNMVLTATERRTVMMMEAEADSVNINDIMMAVSKGIKEAASIARAISDLASKHGKPKRPMARVETIDEALEEMVQKKATAPIEAILADDSLDKVARDNAFQRVRSDLTVELGVDDRFPAPVIRSAIDRAWTRQFRDRTLRTGIRCDGRDAETLRHIELDTDLHSPLHGSAIFQRGQTQVLCTLSFDSLSAALKDLDPVTVSLDGVKEKNFMLHYSFPSYATNDVGKPGRNRRELGHGALAEKGLRAVIPENYPLTMRLTSEVLESNGSSSMATVCGGSLALADAGVPIKELVAGVAVGLISKVDEESKDIVDHILLTDILGIEDYLGDMDFKVCGTKTGVTAVQLDLKLSTGLPPSMVHQALAIAQKAKQRIIGLMKKHLNEKKKRPKANLPKTEAIEVPATKRGYLLGSGGFRLKRVEAETGATFTRLDETTWQLFAPNSAAFDEARGILDDLLRDQSAIIDKMEFGAIYPAVISEIGESGVMVEIERGLDPVFVPTGQLDTRKVKHPSMLGLAVGHEIFVKYFGRDPVTGKLRLSRKVLQANTTSTRLTQ